MIAALDVLALLAAREGESDKADALRHESLDLKREIGQSRDNPLLPAIGAYIALWQGDTTCAAASLRQYQLEAGWAAAAWIAWAGVALLRGQPTRAATLLAAAESDMALGRTRLLLNHYEYHLYVAQVRAHLNEAEFTQAWAAGQAMTLEQATAYALADESK